MQVSFCVPRMQHAARQHLFAEHNSYNLYSASSTMNSRGVEFGFSWLFVLLVGAAILFIAIFAVQRLVKTADIQQSSELAANFDSLLSPLETSVETSAYHTFTLNQPVRFVFDCDASGSLGTDSFTLQTRAGNGWTRAGVPARSSTRYVFSNDSLEGTHVHTFAAPFTFPYKVGDVFFLYTEQYCLVDAPETVRSFVDQLGTNSFNLSDSKQHCSPTAVSVCFNRGDCDITVRTSDGIQGSVTKNRQTVEYYDTLLYGALVASPERYICEVARLRKRAAGLATLYMNKASLLAREGCSTNLEADLLYFSTQLESSASFSTVQSLAEELEVRNEQLICPLF